MNASVKTIARSNLTKTGGISGALVVILGEFWDMIMASPGGITYGLQMMDWSTMAGVGLLAFGLFRARQDDVSSEGAKLKKLED